MPRLHLRHTQHSSAGLDGRANQDAVLFRECRDGSVLAVVADGVGSARAGGEAARRAVDMLADYFSARTVAWSPRRALAEFVARINRQLFRESEARFGSPELLSTLSVVAISGARAYVAGLGDSPVYLRRGDRFERLSELHVSAEPGSVGALTRALGMEIDSAPFFQELDLKPGDVVLLCTDGVSGALGASRLAHLLERAASARVFVADAQDPALRANRERGGADDATALVVEVLGRDDAASPGQSLKIVPMLRAGDVFPHGVLRRPLDEACRVWLAEMPGADAERGGAGSGRVVLKFPPADAAGDDARAEEFLREAWQAARLDFPGFVRSRVPDEPSLRYYVQEYMDAPTLAAVLREGPLAVERVLELGAFLARVAQYLVRLDLAHGDIKPANILVVRDSGAPASAAWDFRLIDLGVAAEMFSVAPRSGTASYLAPERFGSAPVSERTEIYAIGATLYECLARRLPQGEIERFQVPAFSGSPRPPSVHNSAVPDWLDSVLLRCLSPDPEVRYSCYSELAHDLANPKQVKPFHRADAPLLERDPLLFWKILSALLLVLNLVQLWIR